MIKITEMKQRDIAQLIEVDPPTITRFYKNIPGISLTKVDNRIIGLPSDAVEKFLRHRGLDYFYRPSIILTANLCGGVGKTTSTYNLGICLRRLVGKDSPILFIDMDSQSSLTDLAFKEPAKDDEPVFIDYLEGNATLDEILVDAGNNIWFIKSSLNNALMDRHFRDNPADYRMALANFYEQLFEKFGRNLKIFQDHSPQISSVFGSSICALNDLDSSILKTVLIPIRSDRFSIKGAAIIIDDVKSIQAKFKFKSPLPFNIQCFFSSTDKRISVTNNAIKMAIDYKEVAQNLSPYTIRYCAEIPKSIMNNTSVYESGNNKACEDYLHLLHSLYRDYNLNKEIHG